MQTQTVPVVMGGGNYFRDAPERVFCSFPIFKMNVVNWRFSLAFDWGLQIFIGA